VGQTTFIITVVVLVVLIGIVGSVTYNQLQNVNAQYNSLQNTYNSLQNQYNALQSSYNNSQDQYNTLLSSHNTLLGRFNALQSVYNSLQSQYNSLQSTYDALLATPGLTYDITNYGAIPDDQNDDISAFQKILSAHPSNLQIHIPRGTFLISTAIVLNNNNNITIFGEGASSIIKLTAQNNIIRIESSKNVIIKDLALDGSSQYNTGTSAGISAGFYADNLQVQCVYIHDTTGNGIDVYASKNTIINNCGVDNTGKTGINSHVSGFAVILNSVDGAQITNNQINGFFGDSGIFTGGFIPGFLMRNALIDHNTITGAHTDEGSGIGIWGAENCIITNNIIHDDQPQYDSKDNIFQGIDGICLIEESHIIVSDNEVYRITGVGIEINNGTDVLAINNYVHDFQGEARNSAGFYVSAANTLVENNTIEDATHFGILIGVGEPMDNEQIIHNTIRDTRGVSFTDPAGIRIILEGIDKKNLAIIDNTLINNTYGIYKTGSGQLINAIITGNTIIGSQIPYDFH